jgi:hypothetical protein
VSTETRVATGACKDNHFINDLAENWGQNHGARKWLRTLAEWVASQQQAFLRFLRELAARVAGNRTLGNFSTSGCKALNDNDLRQ